MASDPGKGGQVINKQTTKKMNLQEIQKLRDKAKAEKAIERIVAFGQEFRQTNEIINFYRKHYGLTLISTGAIKEPSLEDQARKFALINRAIKVQLWDERNKPYELVNRRVVWR